MPFGRIRLLLTSMETKGHVLYDGACGVCSRWVPFWEPTLLKLGLRTAALQSDWVLERTGLSPDELLKEMRLLHVDGRMTSGPDVYRYVMQRLWWAYPLYVASVLPVGRQMFNMAYRTFAKHRMKVSQICHLPPRQS